MTFPRVASFPQQRCAASVKGHTDAWICLFSTLCSSQSVQQLTAANPTPADGTSIAIDSNRSQRSGKTHMLLHVRAQTQAHTHWSGMKALPPPPLPSLSSRSDKQLRMQHSQPTHLNGTATLLASHRWLSQPLSKHASQQCERLQPGCGLLLSVVTVTDGMAAQGRWGETTLGTPDRRTRVCFVIPRLTPYISRGTGEASFSPFSFEKKGQSDAHKA